MNLLGQPLPTLIEAMASLGEPPHRARQLVRWIYRRRIFDFAAMTDLSAALRRRLSDRFEIAMPSPAAHQIATDGTEKLLFRDDDSVWEAVLMRDGPRRTVCVSTQSGCGLGCRFCATATLGFGRNLSPGEIIGQIITSGQLLPAGERVTNVVFMGMGEPLQNFDAVKTVLDLIAADWGLDISHRRTTVSTVGLVPEIHRWAEEKIKANLAISLSAADDELRSRLMPINRKWPLAALKEAAIAVTRATGRRITFEYILIDGVNDSIADAKKLVRFVHGIPCKINLIRFHPHPGSEFRRPSEERVIAFRDYLYPRCPAVNVRKSFGLDIAAACGQLAGQMTPVA
ncbi:MAG: 23S rRNA (adenine(2503)-C(2))-methyltransferase RlmN [Candidatus Zixiibacteriota bacterium]